ncbi:hypothetical protein Lpar_3573 [Legionella parisiensis]|uniref:Uncharacterized protein n=2 Tax=Legionella parisiensis TaxID=45071 RepID=A0A1E5JXZ3_9GAMM|nr:hypothetical protein Lpar_3573 [Legionella parisiensis]OEH48928.1 hypothetical protein lpari_00073 [Legionella parisiensis]STX72323.1 Uncharacterised protein [Legionella parisiensis]
MNEGDVRLIDSNDELRTTNFGGCTAIHAKNENMFGLYHLQTIADRPDNQNNATYKEWLLKLKDLSNGQPIYFEIGTPKNKKGLEHHPYLGMERYLRALCEENNIQIAGIKLLDMDDVESISVTRQQMTCFSEREYEDVIPIIPESVYQSDEAMLEQIENMKAISFILGDPNMDLNGTLKTKYQETYDQYREGLSSQREEILIKIQSLVTLDDHNARDSFLDGLYKAVRSVDFDSIRQMARHPYFKGALKEEKNLYNMALDLAARTRALKKDLNPLPVELENYNPLDNKNTINNDGTNVDNTSFKSKYMQLKGESNANSGPEQDPESCTIL